MAEKLNWVYNDRSTEQHAFVGTDIRIRAVRDDHAECPLDDEGTWPTSVRSPDGYGGRSSFKDYGEVDDVRRPLAYFSDAQVVHFQVHIAKLLDTTVYDLMECYGTDDPVKYCTDVQVLRDVFYEGVSEVSDRQLFEVCKGLYDLVDIPCHVSNQTGYSQGDWAEVMVVAPPKVVEKFGCATPITSESLAETADLWGAWAWGDVYGYIVERIVLDEDGDVDEDLTEELESCWGYYGSDHGDSGLEEAALAACPKAPTTPETMKEAA